MAQISIKASKTPPVYIRDSIPCPPLLMPEKAENTKRATIRAAMIGSNITQMLHRAAVRSFLAPACDFTLNAGLVISTPKAFFILIYATRVATHIASVIRIPTNGIFKRIPNTTAF